MSAIVIPGAIPPDVVAQIRARVSGARFVSGRTTAAGGALSVKQNQQLAADDPGEVRAVELLVGALQAHGAFQAATWPDAMMRPMFCRYGPGMRYGDHVDAAIMGEPPNLLRCDIAVTVCLSDASEYDGGELVVDAAGLAQAWKGRAGDAITYPAGTLHRVTEVTRGVREVAILWIQTLVRDPGHRRILFDLRAALGEMEQAAAAAAPTAPTASYVEAVRRSYYNLVRMWV